MRHYCIRLLSLVAVTFLLGSCGTDNQEDVITHKGNVDKLAEAAGNEPRPEDLVAPIGSGVAVFDPSTGPVSGFLEAGGGGSAPAASSPGHHDDCEDCEEDHCSPACKQKNDQTNAQANPQTNNNNQNVTTPVNVVVNNGNGHDCDDDGRCESQHLCLYPHDPSTTVVNASVGEFTLDAIDPAQAYSTSSWGILNLTCTRLFIFDELNNLVSEAAAINPSLIDVSTTTVDIPIRGATFFFNTGGEVTPDSFITEINRAKDPALDTGASAYYNVISNMQNIQPGNILRLTLSAVTPDILQRLALPFACAVPVNTPFVPQGINPIPMSGRYYFAKVLGTQGPYGAGLLFSDVILKRNDRVYPDGYPGPQEANPQQIEFHYTPNIDPTAEANQLYNEFLNGCLEYDNGTTSAILENAKTRHPDLYFEEPSLTINYYVFNFSTQRSGIFSSCPDVARIVNLAIDRTALSDATPVGTPGSQYLPPGTPGSDGEPYSLNSDIPGAQAVFASLSAGCKDTDITLLTTTNTSGSNYQGALLVQSYLAAAGFDGTAGHGQVILNQQSNPGLVLADPAGAWDIGSAGWSADYPDPYTFMEPLFNSANNSPGGFNYGHYSQADTQLNAIAPITPLSARNAAFGTLATQMERSANFIPPIAVYQYGLSTFLVERQIQCPFPDLITYIEQLGNIDEGYACLPAKSICGCDAGKCGDRD